MMPWLTIIMALLSFFASKKSGASNTKAALTAGLVGAGTYFVSHETDWGRTNLGALDGVDLGAAGSAVVTPGGNATDGSAPTTTTQTPSTGIFDVLRSWGATGTAAVIGTGAAATGSGVFSNKYVVWGLLGLGAFLILRN